MATTKKSTTVKPEIPIVPSPDGNPVTTTKSALSPIKFTYPAQKNLTKEGTLEVELSSLISLDETSIPNAEQALRELDENNIYALQKAYEAGTPIPRIRVQQSSEGNILVAGYHRLEAMKRLIEESGGDIVNQMVEVVPTHYTTAREVVNAAYVDNFSNGLGVSPNSRSRYALQLMAWDAEDGYPGGKPMSLHKAADLAGCSHQAVMKMRDRLAGKTKTKKMVDTLLSPEDQAEMDAFHAAENTPQQIELLTDPALALNKALKQMFTGLAQAYAITPNVNDLATAFRNYINKDDAQAVTTVALAIQAVTMGRTFGQKPSISK